MMNRRSFVAAMLLLVARLVDVQVLHAGAYQTAARGESSITVSLPSLRGGIYARDGAPLAMSVPTDDVVAVLSYAIYESFPAAPHCRRFLPTHTSSLHWGRRSCSSHRRVR